MTSGRRLSRELALQILFQQEYASTGDLEANLRYFRETFAAPEDVWNYASELIFGVHQKATEIDALIQKHSAHWTLKRMAMVDRNVMRVAVFETRFAQEPIPPAVAINEAVEISRKFGTHDSPAFVNGILDQIVKQ
jgi:N utilization substance protein B